MSDATSRASATSSRGVLEFFTGLALLVLLDRTGAWVVRVAHLPVPGSVLGMVTLTTLVVTNILPADRVRAPANFLVRHLALMYIPAGAAIVMYAGAVREGIVAIVIASIVSLVAVLLVVGTIVERLEPRA